MSDNIEAEARALVEQHGVDALRKHDWQWCCRRHQDELAKTFAAALRVREDQLTTLTAEAATLRTALHDAIGDMEWMTGGWDGSMPHEEEALVRFRAERERLLAILASPAAGADLVTAVRALVGAVRYMNGVEWRCLECNRLANRPNDDCDIHKALALPVLAGFREGT